MIRVLPYTTRATGCGGAHAVRIFFPLSFCRSRQKAGILQSISIGIVALQSLNPVRKLYIYTLPLSISLSIYIPSMKKKKKKTSCIFFPLYLDRRKHSWERKSEKNIAACQALFTDRLFKSIASRLLFYIIFWNHTFWSDDKKLILLLYIYISKTN